MKTVQQFERKLIPSFEIDFRLLNAQLYIYVDRYVLDGVKSLVDLAKIILNLVFDADFC